MRGATSANPFWDDMSVHQKFVMQLNFLARRSTWYDTTNPLTGDDGQVGYAPEAISAYDAGGRTPGTLLGMAMYNQDVGGLDAADLARMESLKGYITRNYMRHQEAHAYCVGAQCYQALCAPYLSDRQQRFVRRDLLQEDLQIRQIGRLVHALRDTARTPAHMARHRFVMEQLSTQNFRIELCRLTHIHLLVSFTT